MEISPLHGLPINLSKETTQALEVLLHNLSSWDGILRHGIELEECSLETNYTSFSNQKITLLKGQSWRWNRTTHIQDIEIEKGVLVTVSKMNTRSKVARGTSPTFKVWLYTISKGPIPFYFIWCERGRDPLAIEDFSFLRPFVNDSLANEFKWT